MKSLIAGLLIMSAVSVHAASTDSLSIMPVLETPVEQKVVEIHMTTKEAPVMEQTRRNRKIATLPLRGGTCSGSFIDDKGDILTARHCVDGFDAFEVQTYDRRKYVAVVIATSTSHDLAVIHIDRRNTPHFELAENAIRGQRVFVLGSPLGITDTLSEGVIAKLDGDVTLLDCSALPGNSGGPVFDADKKMVGVLNAGYIVMFGVTHLNQAQGLDAVHFFLKEVLEKRYGR